MLNFILLKQVIYYFKAGVGNFLESKSHFNENQNLKSRNFYYFSIYKYYTFNSKKFYVYLYEFLFFQKEYIKLYYFVNFNLFIKVVPK